MTAEDTDVLANSSEPTAMQHVTCEARALVLKPTAVDAGAIVKSTSEDKDLWFDTTQAELDSVLVQSKRWKGYPREVKAVHERGSHNTTAPSKRCSR